MIQKEALIIEAILFISVEPVSISRLSRLLGKTEVEIKKLIGILKSEYKERSFQIVEIKGGYVLCTKPEYADYLEKARQKKTPHLSNASLETLAIISHKGPITRLEIEEIRGVDTSGPIETLLDRGLIKIVGRASKLGAPLLYSVTDNFYNYFKLKK